MGQVHSTAGENADFDAINIEYKQNSNPDIVVHRDNVQIQSAEK